MREGLQLDLGDSKVKGHCRKGFSSWLNVNRPRARGSGVPSPGLPGQKVGVGVHKQRVLNKCWWTLWGRRGQVGEAVSQRSLRGSREPGRDICSPAGGLAKPFMCSTERKGN